MYRPIMLATAFLLSACQTTTNPGGTNPAPGGGSGLAPVTMHLVSDPTSVPIVGEVPAGAADGTDVSLTRNNIPVFNLIRDSRFDSGPYSAAVISVGGTVLSVFASGSTGADGVSTAFYRGPGEEASRYARNGTTVLPTGGSAVFNGDYMGARHYVDGFLSDFNTISGTVTLNADFSGQTVSGLISNRVYHSRIDGSDVGSAPDVSLSGGTIDMSAGTFSGTAAEVGTGGLSATGTFEGLFGGTDAKQAAGAIFIAGSGSGTLASMENGVFMASSP